MTLILIIIIGVALFFLKPWKMGRKDLHALYGVNRQTFDKWVTHFVPVHIDRRGKRQLNGLAVIVIMFFLGNPMEKSMTKQELRAELGLTEHIMNTQIFINTVVGEQAYQMKKFPPAVCENIMRHFESA